MTQLIRLSLGSLALAIWLVARGMRLNPHALDQQVGMFVHLLGVALAFFVFFRFSKTKVAQPYNPALTEVKAARLLIVGGSICLTALFLLLLLAAFGGEIGRTVVAARLDLPNAIAYATLGTVAIIAGMGLQQRATWSRRMAISSGFMFSYIWPLGIALAFYIWWAVPTGSIQQEPAKQ